MEQTYRVIDLRYGLNGYIAFYGTYDKCEDFIFEHTGFLAFKIERTFYVPDI